MITSEEINVNTYNEKTYKDNEPLIRPLPKSQRKISWIPAIFIVGVHLGALAAFFTFSWQALALCVVFHWITGGVGVTLCYHRLLTHRSFKTPKIIEYFLSFIGTLAGQGGPISWVVAHRLHHAYSDESTKDPHSPKDGFFWSHMIWCMTRNPMLENEEVRQKIAPDLANDPIMRFLNNTHILSTFLLSGIFYLWGGWSFVVWGVLLRLVLVYHSTWLVNSAAHVWGYKTYASKDDSTNLWWVALITYGEGWHNNHHAFQTSAKHGLKWWEFDTTYWMIKTLEFFKLASAIKLPTQHMLNTKLKAAA